MPRRLLHQRLQGKPKRKPKAKHPGHAEASKAESSECFAYLKWTPISKAATLDMERSGKPKPGALGKVFMIFRRKMPRYSYTIRTAYSWADWKFWTGRGSLGKKWNRYYIHRV